MITYEYIRAGMDFWAFPSLSYFYRHKDMFIKTCTKDYSLYTDIHTHTSMSKLT
jgi:hypothetical protein